MDDGIFPSEYSGIQRNFTKEYEFTFECDAKQMLATFMGDRTFFRTVIDDEYVGRLIIGMNAGIEDEYWILHGSLFEINIYVMSGYDLAIRYRIGKICINQPGRESKAELWFQDNPDDPITRFMNDYVRKFWREKIIEFTSGPKKKSSKNNKRVNLGTEYKIGKLRDIS